MNIRTSAMQTVTGYFMEPLSIRIFLLTFHMLKTLIVTLTLLFLSSCSDKQNPSQSDDKTIRELEAERRTGD